MAEESVISEEMKKMIGVEAEPIVLEVEKGHIRRFAQAVGDPNPLWQDKAYASKARYGNIIAPPTFLQDWAMHKIAEKLLKDLFLIVWIDTDAIILNPQMHHISRALRFPTVRRALGA